MMVKNGPIVLAKSKEMIQSSFPVEQKVRMVKGVVMRVEDE